MWSNEPQSLPDWIEDAYESLVAATAEQNVGIPREQAYEQLLADETFPDEPADAEYAIDRLLDAGWLYAVDDKLRITDPEC